jgi:hypothetical protein
VRLFHHDALSVTAFFQEPLAGAATAAAVLIVMQEIDAEIVAALQARRTGGQRIFDADAGSAVFPVLAAGATRSAVLVIALQIDAPVSTEGEWAIAGRDASTSAEKARLVEAAGDIAGATV